MKGIYKFFAVMLFVSLTSICQAADESSEVFLDLLMLDLNQMPAPEVEQLKTLLDKSGPVSMVSLETMEETSVMPGSLTAERGLDFVPDTQEAVDAYLAMVDEGVLPFAAIFLTTQMLLDDMESP